jgi:regulator of protease activity HflC (stomatin/prohibitin superfamily)
MQLVPLTVLAAELGIPAAEFADHPAAIVDPASGVRVLPGHICRQLIAAHRAQQQAQADLKAAQEARQRAEAERLAAQYAADDRQRQARVQRQREILADTPGLTALELMLAADSSPNASTPAGRAFDELYQLERQGNLGHMYRFHPDPSREA